MNGMPKSKPFDPDLSKAELKALEAHIDARVKASPGKPVKKPKK